MSDIRGELIGIKSLLSNIFDHVYHNGSVAYNYYESLRTNIYEAQKQTSERVENYVNGIKSSIISTLSNYLGGITDSLNEIDKRLSFINNTLHKIDEEIVQMKVLFETFNSRLTTIMRTLDEFIKEFYFKMEQQITEITNTITNAYEVQNDFIQSQIKQVNNNIDNTQRSLSQDIKTSANETISNIKLSTGYIQQSIQESTSSIIETTNKATNTIMSKIDSELGDISNALDRFQSNMSSDMWKIYVDFKQFVTDIIYTIHGVQIVSYNDGQKIEDHVKPLVDSHPTPEVFV